MQISKMSISNNQPIDSVKVGTAVLAKNLDTIEKAGQAMIKMMEQSVQPSLGNHIDLRI